MADHVHFTAEEIEAIEAPSVWARLDYVPFPGVRVNDELIGGMIDDQTILIPNTGKLCKVCGYRTVVKFEQQTRSPDEGDTPMEQCLTCKPVT